MPNEQQVEVYNPQGKLGTIPPAQLEKAKAAGYKPKADFVEAVHPKTGQTGIIPKTQWSAAEKQGYVMSPREQQRVKAKTPNMEEVTNPFSGKPLPRTPGSDEEAVREGSVPALEGLSAIGLSGLFAPSTITKAGPLVPGGRAATGRMLPWVRSQVTSQGASLARQGVSSAVSGAKNVVSWLKANPVKAGALELFAHEFGLDPIQLARKLIKYGGGK
jgi:hypothetical protein